MPLRKSAATFVMVFALIATLMATAIAAQSPLDGDPEISDAVTVQVTITGELPVFDARLCPTTSPEFDDTPVILDDIAPPMGGKDSGERGVRICYTDTKTLRGPYYVYLVADDFVSTTSPEDTISAENLNVDRMWGPRSKSLAPNVGRIYGRDGNVRIDPALDTTSTPMWIVQNSHGLDKPVIVGEVTTGQGTVETSMRLVILLWADYEGPRGTFTSTLYLDVYAGDTP